jgi:hypothetical protein
MVSSSGVKLGKGEELKEQVKEALKKAVRFTPWICLRLFSDALTSFVDEQKKAVKEAKPAWLQALEDQSDKGDRS